MLHPEYKYDKLDTENLIGSIWKSSNKFFDSQVFPSMSIDNWSLVIGNQENLPNTDAIIFTGNTGVGIFHFFLPLAEAMIETNSFQENECSPPIS